jgi:hypothetical protein
MTVSMRWTALGSGFTLGYYVFGQIFGTAFSRARVRYMRVPKSYSPVPLFRRTLSPSQDSAALRSGSAAASALEAATRMVGFGKM